jgi:very-short-patch-repair endonuclease
VLIEPRHLHVGVPSHATRLRHPDDVRRPHDDARVRLHWNAPPRGAPIASVVETLAEAMTCLPELEALCMLDAAREAVDWMSRPPVLDAAGFAHLLERLPARARRVAQRSITGSQSVGETVARESFRRAGIPARAQVRLPGGVWADLLIGERLVFEVDGEGPHSIPGAFDRDRERWAWLKAIGYAHISFSHAQVVHDWVSVETAVRLMLSRDEHLRPNRPIRPIRPIRPNSGIST